jgi:amino acid adenylation domain-containing protein
MTDQLSETKRALLEKLLAGKRPPSADLTGVRPRPAGEPARLSFAQERLWFLNQLNPMTPAYNMHEALRLRGTLNIDALQQALNTVIARHDILRTVFVAAEGNVTQQLSPELHLTLNRVDLSDRSTVEQAAEIQRRAVEAARRRFDLAVGPLLYVELLCLSDEDHALFITVHHIISDEWSNGLFWNELAAAYQAITQGQTPTLPSMPAQYADYAYWQRQWLNESLLQTQLDYWKAHLGGEQSLIQLPTDRPRPAVQSYRGGMRSVSLPAHLLPAFDALCQRARVTPFMLALAAFQTLLSRISGQADISIGTPIANRSRPEIEPLIGFFLNTLVLRVDLGDDPRFIDLLARAREIALNAYAHADLPFEKLVDELHPRRDLSHNPLFQVMLVYQDEATKTHTLPGLTAEVIPVDGGVAKFDLTLFVTRQPNRMILALEYASDLFNPTTIDRLLNHLVILLTAAITDPDQRVSALPLMSEAERRQIVIDWNATEADYPREKRIHELIEAHADQTPDAPAVMYEREALTYAQLDARANQLAHHLIGLGVQPGDRVALCVERSLEMIVGILGILKAGAAYVPLDPTYPHDRLDFVLADTATPVIITQPHLKSGLPAADAHILILDARWSQISSQPTTRPVVPVTSDHLAYVIYTSGSTGKPKGVPITHRNLVHSTTARFSFYPEPVKRFLLLSSFAFDSSVVGLFWSLCQGGTLVLPRQKQEQDVHDIASLVARHNITHLLCLPSLYHLLLEHGGGDNLGSLNTVMVAGEACTVDLVRAHYRLLPRATLYNEYGPTEGTVWSSACAIPADFNGSLVPIGKPIPNMQAYVLDARQQPVPVGVAGELVIGGEGLTSGYLNRPELTAERFLPNPFHPGKRLYRTGDLARWLPDGQLAFLGRVDHQVKIRGHRIELAEIEAVLLDLPGVAQAVVIARGDTPSTPNPDDLEAMTVPSGATVNTRLIAYVVASAGQSLDAPGLRVALAGHLPDYMLPSQVVLLDAIPLTPNGKLDRAALPEPGNRASTGESAFIEPRTEVEHEIALLWASVLGFDRIGIHDNFFELGGHSLLVTQVIARLRNRFQVELGVTAFFERPTIAQLAAYLQTSVSRTVIAEKKDDLLQEQLPQRIKPVSRAHSQPLSIAQERLWSLTQIAGATPLYNMYNVFRLRGPLNQNALEASLRHLIERHESLRIRFSLHHNQPVQQAQPMSQWTLPVVDLCADPQRESHQNEWMMTEITYPFDPLREGLFRVHLLQLAIDDHVLILVMHHLISDGWSWDVFLRELATLYDTHREGKQAALLNLPIQYLDFAAWQRTQAQSPRYAADLAYWEQTLREVPPLELPLDATRQPTLDFVGARAALNLSVGLAAQIRAFSTGRDVTLFMTLLATFAALLHRITGQRDLLIGTPVAGRSQVELQNIMGYFNNILPLRSAVYPQDHFQDVLARVRGVALGAYDHAEVPLHRLAELPGLTQTPFTRAVFAVQDGTGNTLALADLNVELIPAYNQTANFDLFLTIQIVGDDLRLIVEYRQSLFQPDTISKFLQDYADLLNAGLRKPESLVVDLLPSPRIMMQAQPIPVPSRQYVAPQTPLEYRLVALWEEMLNQQPIGIADSFFDLGGHSLLALRLFSRIQHEFNVNLPLAILFNEPTIHYLATLIQQGDMPMTWNSLVAIQPKGSRAPFFGVHGIDGNVLFWRNIVLHLGEDQPFYGLQSRGIDGRSPALDSIPQMASLYLKEIRQVQPYGPYYLGGYSLGGEIAFEMAQQLIRQGERVALLVMFDTSNPNRAVRPTIVPDYQSPARPSGNLQQRFGAWQRKFGGHLGRLQGLPFDQKAVYLWKDAAMRLARIRLKLVVRLAHSAGRRLPDDLLLLYLREAHIKALLNYIPEVYPGQITIFRAHDSLKDNPVDSPMGWKPLAGHGLQVVVFEGSHADVYNPAYADKIGEMLRKCLDQAQ